MFSQVLAVIAFIASVASSSLKIPSFTPAKRWDIHKRVPSQCPDTGAVSCHNTTVQSNTCCFEAPGVRSSQFSCIIRWSFKLLFQGLLLQTQVIYILEMCRAPTYAGG